MYYHITPYRNINSIFKRGLVPTIGPLSKKQKETHPAVYLFNDLTSAEEAIMNWFGDEFELDERLVIIEINFPKSKRKNISYCDVVGYESQYHGVIDPRWLAQLQIV